MMGRPTIITPELLKKIEQLQARGVSNRRIASELGIARNTLGKALREHFTSEDAAT